jgi:hypothetical protein
MESERASFRSARRASPEPMNAALPRLCSWVPTFRFAPAGMTRAAFNQKAIRAGNEYNRCALFRVTLSHYRAAICA